MSSRLKSTPTEEILSLLNMAKEQYKNHILKANGVFGPTAAELRGNIDRLEVELDRRDLAKLVSQ